MRENTHFTIDKAKTYFAFAGIGNPQRFFSVLQNYGLKLAKCKIYPDHHNYSDQDCQELNIQAEKLDSILITTRKDYVKIGNKLPVICFNVELAIDDSSRLIELIYEKILHKN
jgi:tetraacyldisaccharide 4'-kinase